MIKKVLFIGDYYRGSQEKNVQVIANLITPIFENIDIKINILKDTSKYVDEDRWVKALNKNGISFLVDYDLNNSLIISFEMSKLDQMYLDEHNIPWIDLEIHPIRFLNDLYFSIRSSFDFDFNILSIPDENIKFFANSLLIANIDRQYDIKENSLLILGQEPKDKSIFFDNEFKSLRSYNQQLENLKENYDNIYYRPHPFKTNKDVDAHILEYYNASLLTHINFYDVLGCTDIKAVCGISSSTLHEAKYFNKDVFFLDNRVKKFSNPISVQKFLNCSEFWNNIGFNTKSKLKKLDLHISDNQCRDFFSYWSYETKETKTKEKANEALEKANEAEEKANEAEEKANEALARVSEAEEKANEAITSAHQIRHDLHLITNSNSWRMTKPLRLVKPFIKNLLFKIYKKILRLNQFLILKKIGQTVKRPVNRQKKLLIDCSFIYSTNLNTGIQRVVRNIVNNIGEYAKKENLQLVTVALVNGFIIKIDMTQPPSEKKEDKSKLVRAKDKILFYINAYKEVEVIHEGDILLMLDSTWHLDIWPSVKHAKDRGAKVIGVTYDLIPISHPQFCDENLVRLFTEWYDKSLNYFDAYIAISKTVMLDVQRYLGEKGIDLEKYSFDFFRLGSDFKEHQKSDVKISNELQALYHDNKSIYLIVSTIEPRKNHQYLFEAFKELWNSNVDVTLIIVGRVGWKTEVLLEQMMEHPEYKKRLWIFNGLDDNELSFCYKNSKALLFPSFVEGYGLPIIESIQNNLPVLASDTPIHNEVGGDSIDYFDIKSPLSLVAIITSIENGTKKIKEVNHNNITVLTWKESAKELFEKLI